MTPSTLNEPITENDFITAGAFAVGMEESQRAATAGWTPEEQALVDNAIATVAQHHAQFTADQIWNVLPPGFPVTKGLAARLRVAARHGLIRNSGQVTIATRGGRHDHAQRLSIWQSLALGIAPATHSPRLTTS